MEFIGKWHLLGVAAAVAIVWWLMRKKPCPCEAAR